MALVANQYGYSGNMERITRAQAYQKSGGDSASNYYFGQKKILEINPGHPLIKELLRRVESNTNDQKAKELVELMYEAATIRSGYELRDTAGFADRIESKSKQFIYFQNQKTGFISIFQTGMLRSAMNVSPDEKIDEEPEFDEASAGSKSNEEEEVSADAESKKDVNIIRISFKNFK